MELKVLVIDDEPGLLQMLQVVLGRAGYAVTTVTSAVEGLQLLERNRFDLCLCDLRMPGMDGMGFLNVLKSQGVALTVIVMSAYGSGDDAIAAMKAGAYDYINKPFQSDEILLTLRKAVEREQLKRENIELRSKVSRQAGVPSVIARSESMKRVVAVAARIAVFKSTVLITGESGTGKEVIARLIHEASDRSRKPFIAVNCGAIPEGLMESEFFGHVKGAFTDAIGNRRGLIESAGGGTLFLDEVGELPPILQVKMLRFLQESEVRKVGDTKPVKVDVRVVAATSRDLEQEIAKGRFREDLFYRLNVVPIKIPPLRTRLEDIPPLADHFLQRMKERTSCSADSFAPDAMRALMNHQWPGNVRELENIVERVAVMCDSQVVTAADLPDSVRMLSPCDPAISLPLEGLSLKVNQRALEISLISRALEATGGNRTHAARILEMSHRALLYKLKEYGLGKAE
ncbi:MAG TPA: sigma-54 dependent transcriptional regulator [Myxococcota bacterium]|nr:sigma-54 dependent transcriptional regulator [Myxococcota bacterium]HOA13234.1 sigma-54 dependent transcriptional regulator [Myxococcota bacterium]HOD00277.1 sigma-54 dependent transcriptional regulator [Myxococcota bacterium]HOH76238.1 sigma-54 dependent transcriptional regulator [Myxococcota bacterium]HPV03019.1 sigma-54 dependent transcriptional regulator [Myxococcota bacterium]